LVGADQRAQELVLVTCVSENEYRGEDIADVRFVPLIGEEGWASAKEGEGRAGARRALRPVSPEEETLVRNLAGAAESFPSIEGADLNPLMSGSEHRVREPLFRSNSTNTSRSTKLAR
jgi:hypothetical protein